MFLNFRKHRGSSSDSNSSGVDSPTRSKRQAERKEEVDKFQSEMEREMEKRKERIEAWRAERKKKTVTDTVEPAQPQVNYEKG